MRYSNMDPEARVFQNSLILNSVGTPITSESASLNYSFRSVPLSTTLCLPTVRVHLSSTRCQIFGSKPRPNQCVHKYVYPPALWPPSNGCYMFVYVCAFVIGIVSIVGGYNSREVSYV